MKSFQDAGRAVGVTAEPISPAVPPIASATLLQCSWGGSAGAHLPSNPISGPSGKAPLTSAALLQDGYTRDGLAQTLKSGITPNAGKVGGEMGLVVTDKASHWSDDNRTAVADYLLICSSIDDDRFSRAGERA